MKYLPEIGTLTDESDAPFIYLALTSRGEGSSLQGIRLVIDCDSRQKAIELGRSHYRLLTRNDEGNHFGAQLIEEWAYRVDESEFIQWEEPTPEVIVETEGVTVIETKRPRKR